MSLRSASSCLLSAGLLLASFSASRGEGVFDSISQEVRDVFEKSKKAVVRIEAVDDHGKLSGTGFFIDPDGTILTAYTIGGESRDITVLNGDMKFPATRSLADSRSGIAILKIESQTPFLPIGKSSALAVASPVIAVGYPMDLPISPSFGMIAGFDLKFQGRFFSTTHIRANLPVQRGQGGAPLLNLQGEVVGILISGLDNGAGCYALPIEAAEKVRKDYVRFGDAHYGWLGIDVGPAAEAKNGSTVQVENMVPDGPAEKFGLKRGDVLLSLGGKKISAPEDVLNASFFLSAGDQVPVVVVRNGETVSLTVQPGQHPSVANKTAQALQPSAAGSAVPLKLER
jgi:serine protease Do